MDAAELLRRTKIEVAPEIFYLVSVRFEDWLKLLENPELSPRMHAPFMIFRDKFETTLLLDEIDYGAIRHAVRDAKVESGFRLVTFDIELGWNVVGFLALITKILADAGIPVGSLAAFSRDHLLIKQSDLPKALKVLGEYVDEVC